MCNTVTIRYSCNHSVQFHRSTCRSVIWVARPTTKINKTTRKLPKRPLPKADHNDDPETPSRGRTLERSSSMLDLSLPLSTQSRSPSPAPKIVSRPACKSSSEIMLRAQQKCGPCQRTTRRGFLQTTRARSELPLRKKRKHLKRGQPISGGSPLKHELTLEELLEPETDDQIRKRSVGFVGMMDPATQIMPTTQMTPTTQTATNRITQMLRLEPERFWRCWRRFDGIGRRYVDLING